jgi:hypothetical protein
MAKQAVNARFDGEIALSLPIYRERISLKTLNLNDISWGGAFYAISLYKALF